MNLKILGAMIGTIFLGYLCGKFIFRGYDKTIPIYAESGIVYFLQQGVYSSKESMEKNVGKLDQYLYQESDGKYYVYFGMTSKRENADKIKNLYESNSVSVYIKESYISNQDFLDNLIQYDILLTSSDSPAEIDSVLKAILSSYREFVVDTK